VTYADYTASGAGSLRQRIHRGLHPGGEVMPLYANTHTETSGTGRQTTRGFARTPGSRSCAIAVGGGDDDADYTAW
jgi:hypothetical protein